MDGWIFLGVFIFCGLLFLGLGYLYMRQIAEQDASLLEDE